MMFQLSIGCNRDTLVDYGYYQIEEERSPLCDVSMSEHVAVRTMYGCGLTHPCRQAATECLENSLNH